MTLGRLYVKVPKSPGRGRSKSPGRAKSPKSPKRSKKRVTISKSPTLLGGDTLSFRETVQVLKDKLLRERSCDLQTQVTGLRRAFGTLAEVACNEIETIKHDNKKMRLDFRGHLEMQDRVLKDCHREISFRAESESVGTASSKLTFLADEIDHIKEKLAIHTSKMEDDEYKAQKLDSRFSDLQTSVERMEAITDRRLDEEKAMRQGQAQAIIRELEDEMKTQSMAYQTMVSEHMKKIRDIEFDLETSRNNNNRQQSEHSNTMELESRIDAIQAEMDVFSQGQKNLQNDLIEVASFSRQCFDLVHLYVGTTTSA